MDSSTRLPLLRLPSLAIDAVLSTMIPFELINLSKASTTCNLIVKSFSKNRIQKNFEIGVSNIITPMIRFIPNEYYCYDLKITDDIEKVGTRDSENKHDYHYEIAYMYSNGENLMKKCMDVFMEIKQLFNVDINYCGLCLTKFTELHQTILDWLLENGRLFTNLYMYPFDAPVALVDQTLNVLTMVKRVHIAGRTTPNCEYSIPDHIEELIVDRGQWVKLEHLLSFKAPTIDILRSELTNEDLNALLKSWMNMESLQQLKSLCINLIDPDNFDSVLQDIPHQIGHPDRTTLRYFSPGEYLRLNGGFDIEMKDGVTASIFVQRLASIAVCMFINIQIINS